MASEKKFEGQNEWDKRKIGMATATTVILLIGFFAAKIYLTKGSVVAGTSSVKGASTDVSATPAPHASALNISSALQEKINTIRQEISTMNFSGVASSSSQFQKLINDFKDLQNIPGSGVKDFCQKVCGK